MKWDEKKIYKISIIISLIIILVAAITLFKLGKLNIKFKAPDGKKVIQLIKNNSIGLLLFIVLGVLYILVDASKFKGKRLSKDKLRNYINTDKITNKEIFIKKFKRKIIDSIKNNDFKTFQAISLIAPTKKLQIKQQEIEFIDGFDFEFEFEALKENPVSFALKYKANGILEYMFDYFILPEKFCTVGDKNIYEIAIEHDNFEGFKILIQKKICNKLLYNNIDYLIEKAKNLNKKKFVKILKKFI